MAASEIGQLITQHLEKPWFVSLFWKLFFLSKAKEKKGCNKGDKCLKIAWYFARE